MSRTLREKFSLVKRSASGHMLSNPHGFDESS
jgi:hypothetical protein